MTTANITVPDTWTQIASAADAALVTGVSGYGEVCQYTGTPPETLSGHPIGKAAAQNAYQITGEIYARATNGCDSLILAVT